MSKSKVYGSELDSISGKIAQFLYPESNIKVQGFEESKFSNNFFDVAVGNVPFERYLKDLESNVYKCYNSLMITDNLRYTSERLFEKYCEKNENVKYVYKNGDSGQQYLSIVYGMNFDKQILFYPDHIVQLRDETIWLIETKGGEKQGQSKKI